MKQPITSKVKLLTITQASQLIDGLTTYRIRKLCQSGEIPCLMSGNKYLIQEDVLLNFISSKQSST